MSVSISLCLAILLLALALLKLSNASKHKAIELPRLQKWPWLFGLCTLIQDTLELRDANSSTRSALRHAELGHTYQSSILGSTNIHTIYPENILAVATNRFSDYGKGQWARLIALFMGDGILVNDGEAWEKSRALLKPLFKRNRRADIAMFEPHVDALIHRLHDDETDHVDFRRAVQMTVLDITTDLLCFEGRGEHTSIDREPTESRRHLLDIIDQLEPHGNLAIELGVLAIPLILGRVRQIWGFVRGIQDFFELAIAKADQHAPSSVPQSDSFVGKMQMNGLERNAIQGELQNIFFAAFDTSTALLANLFDSVSRDGRIWNELKQEADTIVVGRDKLEEPDLNALVYLRATIFETLRLHSPVTSHTRTALVDTTLPVGPNGGQGIVVPKGTAVTWSTYALNRSPSIYKDPEAFCPERWLATISHGRTRIAPFESSFMPFGTGPRNCMGQAFALSLIAYIAARIISETDKVELKDAHVPFQEAAAVTYYNGHGTFIRFVRSGVQKN